MRVRFSILLVAVACAWCFPGDIYREFVDNFGRLKTLSARFEQEVETPLGTDSASGQIWIRRPTLIKWEYRQPEQKVFLLDGFIYKMYLPAENQLIIQRLDPEEIDASPLPFILGRRRQLEETYAAQPVDATGSRARFLLTARKAGLAFPRVILTLAGSPPWMEELVLFEENGTTHRYRFTEFIPDPRLPEAAFRLETPKGVEVIEDR